MTPKLLFKSIKLNQNLVTKYLFMTQPVAAGFANTGGLFTKLFQTVPSSLLADYLGGLNSCSRQSLATWWMLRSSYKRVGSRGEIYSVPKIKTRTVHTKYMNNNFSLVFNGFFPVVLQSFQTPSSSSHR